MPSRTQDEREGQARELLRALRQRSRSQQYTWGGDMSVEAGLLLEGSRFEFVQAMRLLTRIARRLSQTAAQQVPESVGVPRAQDATLPEVAQAPGEAAAAEDVGLSPRMPNADAAETRFSIRLRSRVGLDFSAASVHSIRLSPEKAGEIEVIANLLALGGQNAPLPDPYTEMLLERQRLRDMAMTDFFDIFHHRLLELYFASTLHTAPWLEWQHPEKNELAQLLYAIAGLGPRDLRNRMLVPDRFWLRYAGLLWQRPRPAIGFEQIVAEHFGVPVRLGQPVGRWVEMESEDRSRLGHASCRLGQSATLGGRVWLPQAGVTLHVGPMDRKTFDSFLPSGGAHAELQEMAAFYFEGGVTLDLELELHPSEVRSMSLGGARLGWTAWVRPPNGKEPLKVRVSDGRAAAGV